MKLNKYLTLAASIALVGGGLVSTSCSDDLDLKPIDYFSATGFWGEQSLFEGNITALMNQWRSNYDGNLLQVAGELRAGHYALLTIDGSAINSTPVVSNNISEANPVFTNYANIYGMIANCNTFLYYAEKNASVLADDAKNYMEGMIYGMRAYMYFQIYKIWGTGPLRLDCDVMLGDYNITNLYKKRAEASEILAQIKSDIAASLAAFNAGSTYSNSNFKSTNGVYYWTKAATEMLAGEVYLWSAKVNNGDQKATCSTADIQTAKGYFENVANNYGFTLQDDYFSVWDVNNRGNKEIIFATRYDRDEATWTNWYAYLFSTVTGVAQTNYWNCCEQDGLTPSPNASRLGSYYNPLTQTSSNTTFYLEGPAGVARYQYKNALYYHFNDADSRKTMFIPVYMITPEDRDNDVQWIENFDTDTATMAAAFCYKYKGQEGYSGHLVGGVDMVYYRLPLVYMYLAECANYLDDANGFVTNINRVRQRAYGANWDEATYGAKFGTFAENELTILQEKDKEFVQEGQRWWDLMRLSVSKACTTADHFVFQPQGCIGYGLNPADFKKNHFVEVSANWGDVFQNEMIYDKPVLDYATQDYFIYLPLDTKLRASDKELEQTPGYPVTSEE